METALPSSMPTGPSQTAAEPSSPAEPSHPLSGDVGVSDALQPGTDTQSIGQYTSGHMTSF